MTKLPKDHKGRVVLTITTHDVKSVCLVCEFIYGDKKVEALEHPFEDEPAPIIQDCILLFNLGHDFAITQMVKYALKHLGMYLSKKLKEICLYPVSKAVAPQPNDFIDDLEKGIVMAEKARPGATEGFRKDHPRNMLLDFLVAGRDVLLRDAGFRFRIDDDDGEIPGAFIKDLLLAQFCRSYRTAWMAELMVRPERVRKPVPKKRGNCAGCGEGVSKDQTVVFNPWAYQHLAMRYIQFCCEKCAEGMDSGDGAGVRWDTFQDVKEE
jgi:hypothetical protein